MNSARNSKKGLLRQRAERRLSKKSPIALKIEDGNIKKLVHELQVHQVELEMQNQELRRAQAEIEESRTKYSDLYDFAPVGYFTFSPAGEIVEVNLTGATLLGIDRTKLLRREFSTFVDPQFRSLFRDHRLSVLEKGGKVRCELKLVRKDGKSFYASLESILVSHGRNHRIRSAVSDITELRKIQEKDETEHAFRVAIENSILSGIAAVDLEGRQSYVNLGFCRMVGRSEEELVGRKPPFAYWPPEESEHISQTFQAVMRGKAPHESVQLRFMRKNGERFDALVLSSPLKDSKGKVVGWIGTIGDITHLKQLEKELNQPNTQLEERVRQRTAELETANEQLGQQIAERKQAEEALRESKERYRSLATNVPSVLMRYDKNLRILFLSPKAEEVTGIPIHRFIGKTNREVGMPEHLCLLWENAIQEVFRTGQAKELDFDFPSKKGTKSFYLILAPEFGANGEVRHVLGISTDITERKQLEEELRKSRDELEVRIQERTAELMDAVEELQDEISERKRAEEAVKAERQRFNDVLEMLPAYVVLLTPDYHVPFANRFFRERFGESLGRRCFEYLFGRSEPCEICETYTVAKTNAPHHWEWVGPDGRIYDIYDFPFTDTDGSPLILEMGIDITDRKRAEEALRQSEIRLRYLSSQLLTVQENERRSIARELHDGVGQLLTAVKFKIESALQLKSKKKSLEAVIPLLRESIEEVRRVQMDLRPSTLDDLGVLPTLEWLFREYQKIYSQIRIEKKTGLLESDVPVPVKTVIYRVTQEALSNIAKHSKANHVRFSLNKKENKIELTIRDDGIGFDLEQTLNQGGARRGLGLTTMRERIQLSGGSYVIESTPGQGTTLTAIWTT